MSSSVDLAGSNSRCAECVNPAARKRRSGLDGVHDGAAHYETLLKTPTTRPQSAASRVLIGFIFLFSG